MLRKCYVSRSQYFLKSGSVALICVYSATNCVFAHTIETTFWAERRRVQQHNSRASNPIQLAGLPGGLNIPDVSPLAADLHHSDLLSSRIKSILPDGSDSLLLPIAKALPQNLGTIRKII